MYQRAKYPPILRRANILNEASSSPPLIAILVLTSAMGVVSAEEEVTSNADLDDCCAEDDVVARATGVTNGAFLAETVARRARARKGERMVSKNSYL